METNFPRKTVQDVKARVSVVSLASQLPLAKFYGVIDSKLEETL